MALANTRHIRIRRAADDSELTVPADVVEMFGPDADLELKIEPGQVTIRRAEGLPQRVGEVLEDPSSLRHLSRPLTDAERDALAAFLAE
jgi:hypothetical protein